MLGLYWLNKYDSNSLTDREIKNLNNFITGINKQKIKIFILSEM